MQLKFTVSLCDIQSDVFFCRLHHYEASDAIFTRYITPADPKSDAGIMECITFIIVMNFKYLASLLVLHSDVVKANAVTD